MIKINFENFGEVKKNVMYGEVSIEPERVIV